MIEKALLTRVVAARGEVISVVHSHEDACYARDAFAKVRMGLPKKTKKSYGLAKST